MLLSRDDDHDHDDVLFGSKQNVKKFQTLNITTIGVWMQGRQVFMHQSVL